MCSPNKQQWYLIMTFWWRTVICQVLSLTNTQICRFASLQVAMSTFCCGSLWKTAAGWGEVNHRAVQNPQILGSSSGSGVLEARLTPGGEKTRWIPARELNIDNWILQAKRYLNVRCENTSSLLIHWQKKAYFEKALRRKFSCAHSEVICCCCCCLQDRKHCSWSQWEWGLLRLFQSNIPPWYR